MSSTPLKAPTAEQRAEFERDATISFPNSAKLVSWREEQGMDSATWLQFKMPAKDFQAFIDSSPLREATLAGDDAYQMHQFRDFMATPPTQYRAGQQALANGRVLNVLVDESDGTTVIVYLMLHDK